jgi:peptide/nickel transport system permease protein
MSLLKYTIRRLLALIPILFGVLFMSFTLTRMMPGNPYLFQIQGEHITQSQIDWYNDQVEALGLDKNPVEQFFIYLGRLFSGDWGTSITVQEGAEVWELIGSHFPRTMEITLLSMVFATFFGMKAGIISAVNRNGKKDTIIRFFALVGVAVPVFWLGLLLQYLFAYKIDILPGSNYNTVYFGDPTPITHLRILDSLLTGEWEMAWDTILHLIMPVFTLSFISLAGITRQTRSSMLEVLELDYIRTARAKGCKEKDVINKHAFRNALIPTITIVGLNFAGLLGGAVLTESTFNLRGMGVLTLRAIQSVDYYVINASVFLMTIIFVTVNLITDIVYGLVDPRIRF